MKRLLPSDVSTDKYVTVLLAEDQGRFRKSLKALVEADGDIRVIGEAKNGREAVRLHGELRPQVIVMDIAMPLLNGIQATRLIMAASPLTRILILSAHPDPEYVKEAIVSGASGYLVKQSSTPLVAQAIRAVVEGKAWFSPSLSKELCDEVQKLFLNRKGVVPPAS